MDDQRIVPVNVRTMRKIYRDIISVSSAGEGMYEVLAGIAPLVQLDVCSVAWTGNVSAPVAIRREQSFDSKSVESNVAPSSTWRYLARGSKMARILNAEYEACYPDARRNYSHMHEFGHDAYKLVIGNRLISVVFDPNNPLARLNQQVNSLLDLIAQALLDYYRREIRHFQDQIILTLNQAEYSGGSGSESQMDHEVRTFLGEGDEVANVAYDLLGRNAEVIAAFFDITTVEFLLAPEISKLIFFRQVLNNIEVDGVLYHSVEFPVGTIPASHKPQRILDFPMQWGSSNEDDRFIIRLHSHRDMNAHVRKSLMLSQVMIKCKEQVEALFDRRYREHRIYQDNKHFERCKLVRNQVSNIASLRQHLHDSVAEYEELARIIPADAIFPQYEQWKDKLASVIKDTESERLEFRDEIRMRDLREYKYLNMKVPQELRKILIDAMNPDVYLHVESDHPVLQRMSDMPVELDISVYERKQIFFNTAATISVYFPKEPHFRFNRLRGKFHEYLESVGEGFGKLFAFINTQTGIKNRFALMQSLEYLIHQVHYSSLVMLEVSSLDISSFKIFNELFGHPFGDRVIRYTAHRLDDFSPGYAYHVSGDEYYIVHCYHQETSESWMQEFFASKEIISASKWKEYRRQLDAFTNGMPVTVPFSDISDDEVPEIGPLGTYKLVDFIGNFFTRDASGAVALKKYSRTGNDYQNVIFDHHGKVQALVDLCWQALQDGKIELGGDSFAHFVLTHSTIGASIQVVPSLTIGTVSYNSQNILPYVSDIVDAADQSAGKNKK